MKIGAWIHNADGPPLDEQVEVAATNGVDSVRSYTLSYSANVAPSLRRTRMSLLGGMHIDAARLVEDWRSQLRFDDLARYHELRVPLEARGKHVLF